MLKLKPWPLNVKSWLIGKDSDAGRDWGQREKGTTGWDGWMASPTRCTWVWVNSEVGDGQGGLECCDSWGRKDSDTTERLNWTELNHFWSQNHFLSNANSICNLFWGHEFFWELSSFSLEKCMHPSHLFRVLYPVSGGILGVLCCETEPRSAVAHLSPASCQIRPLNWVGF